MKKIVAFLTHIEESNKKLNSKSLIEKISLRLLSLEFKSNKAFKMGC